MDVGPLEKTMIISVFGARGGAFVWSSVIFDTQICLVDQTLIVSDISEETTPLEIFLLHVHCNRALVSSLNKGRGETRTTLPATPEKLNS